MRTWRRGLLSLSRVLDPRSAAVAPGSQCGLCWRGCSFRRSGSCANACRHSGGQFGRLMELWRIAANAIMRAWQCTGRSYAVVRRRTRDLLENNTCRHRGGGGFRLRGDTGRCGSLVPTTMLRGRSVSRSTWTPSVALPRARFSRRWLAKTTPSTSWRPSPPLTWRVRPEPNAHIRRRPRALPARSDISRQGRAPQQPGRIYAAACMRGGLQPDLLSDAGWWQTLL